MTKDEALRLALDALRSTSTLNAEQHLKKRAAVIAIKEALAAPTVQEPAGYWQGEFSKDGGATLYEVPQESVFGRKYLNIPLYTAPPATPAQEPDKRECMNCAAFGECHPNNDAGRCGYESPAAPVQDRVATLLLQSKQNFERNFGSNGCADWIYEDLAELLDATPPVAQAWDEGYQAGVNDERTSEANIGIAGFDAKVEPARNNPYRTTPRKNPAS